MSGRYSIYLRKSRADRDAESSPGGEGDTLLRHRTTLLALAHRMGLTIHSIYEEVVSGESIANRPEMQRLLSEVERGGLDGVLVMEVERLARGNTRDQGIVAEAFQYSDTKIVTPSKTYDPSNESDQEYFEFGLFMSRREYKAINRRLQRGRMASLQEGKYIASSAPYGYEKVKLKGTKGYTLSIVQETGAVVRHIFELYTNGIRQPDGGIERLGSSSIARRLDLEGVPSPSGGRWNAYTVRDILNNPTYAGYVRWSWRPTVRKLVDGVLVESHPVDRSVALIDGLHPAIIRRDTWQQAQDILSARSHLPVPRDKTIVNPLAGLVRCDLCGRSLVRMKGRRGNAKDMLLCPNKDCACKGSTLEAVEDALLDSLRLWLQGYALKVVPAPKNQQDKHVAALEKTLETLTREQATLHTQQGRLHDFLEQGVYAVDVFLQRQRELSQRMTMVEETVAKTTAQLDAARRMQTLRVSMLPRVEWLCDVYAQLETPREKNEMLRACVETVRYTKTVGSRYQKSDMSLKIYPKLLSPTS